MVHSDDDCRVCLSELPGVVGSDYINASFITVRISQYIHTLYIPLNDYLFACGRDMQEKITTLLHKVKINTF